MCGIVGVVGSCELSHQKYSSLLDQALEKLSHRGPDGIGKFIDKRVAFGHARLSVLDLSAAGHQPMISLCSNYVISYNGEVYNFQSLREKLEQKGSKFISRTDTEVVLEHFKNGGVSALGALNGMFAFSIYDKNAGKVFVARDRFGIKPLYYKSDQDKVVFASEIKGIDAIFGKSDLNKDALAEWSYFGTSLRDKTVHAGIKQLLPGHFLEIDVSSLKCRTVPYWRVELVSKNARKEKYELSDVVAKTRELLEQAVQKQLVADVDVGVFLSGGLDSSAITAFAAKHYDRPLKTYSVDFDFDSDASELKKAAMIAKEFRTDHFEFQVSGYDVADIVQKMVYHHDGPFSDAANIPLYLLGERVRDSTKVVLQGDGGDELFAGYRRYTTLSAYGNSLRHLMRGLSLMHRKLCKPNKQYFSRQRYLNALGANGDAEVMALLLTVEDQLRPPTRIFREELRQRLDEVDPFEAYRECDERFSNEDLVQRMLYTDTQLILPNVFLEKVDRATMATSIEVRVPFLDNDLSEFIMSLPSSFKIKRGNKKWLLKQALKGVLPQEILTAKKSGFGVPFGFWLQGPLFELFNDSITTLKSQGSEIFDWEYVDLLQREHSKGLRDNSFLLWKVLNLMLWLQHRD